MLEGMLAQAPSEGRAMFVDMNSFFASVEQQANPSLRGKPVGVCPYVDDATCVIAASVEAKRFGITTGTPIPEARRLCPSITLIGDNPALYREYHNAIMTAFNNTRCRVVTKSIDEAYLEVPRDLRDSTRELAAEVKIRIRDIGDQLTCSIGIASNLFLAKMGSNYRKPDGLTVLRQADLEAFYGTLQLRDLHGIARRMTRRFQLLGIYTPLDLYHADYALLRQHFGANGQAWYLRLRGYEVDLKPTTRRMIGHQTTIVPAPAESYDKLLSIGSQLLHKAIARLRNAGFYAQSLSIDVRYTDRSHWSQSYRSRRPFSDNHTAHEYLVELLSKTPLPRPVRRLSVVMTDLVPDTAVPQSLFQPPGRIEAMAHAVDEIEARWGRATIMPARHLLTQSVSDRIGFGNAPDSAQTFRTKKAALPLRGK